MHALRGTVKTLPNLIDFSKIPPTPQPAMDNSTSILAKAPVGIQFLKGTLRWGDVASMAIEKVKVLEALASQ
jgi:hypothetical protein